VRGSRRNPGKTPLVGEVSERAIREPQAAHAPGGWDVQYLEFLPKRFRKAKDTTLHPPQALILYCALLCTEVSSDSGDLLPDFGREEGVCGKGHGDMSAPCSNASTGGVLRPDPDLSDVGVEAGGCKRM
jgi:hypothetical protein